MAAAIATAFAATVAAVASVVVALINRKQSRALAEVKHQVKNSHGTNLRDDLDKVIGGLGEVKDDLAVVIKNQGRHDSEIAGIREEQRIHRMEHLKQ